MTDFLSYCAVYRNIHETDETHWETVGGYLSFADVLHDVLYIHQFKGLLVNCGWFIYGVQSDGKKVQLDQDGKRVCPSG